MSRWGVSWGIGGIRYGESPNGKRWVSYSILGFRFFKYLDGDSGRNTREQLSEPEEYAEPAKPEPNASRDPASSNDNLLERLD